MTSSSFLARNQLGARPILASDMPNRAASLATTKSQCKRKLVAAGDGVALHDRDHRQGVELDRVEHGLDRRRPDRLAAALAKV